MRYRITNWQEYQHYKDRCPPWIKLHHSLITSETWVTGNDASRALAIACMLLASRDNANDGSFNGDPEYIKRFAYLNSKPDFSHLINHGFIECLQDASNALAECNTEQSRAEKRQRRADTLSSQADKPPADDRIPYQKIIDLYHDKLPTLPKVMALTTKRKGQIGARWRSGTLPDLETWREFFNYCSQSDFLMGRTEPSAGRKRFFADFEWLTNETNFTKIWEGKYHERKL